MIQSKKTKCPDCGKRYTGFHAKAACQLYQATTELNKFGAKTTERDGRTFASGLEGAVYDILKLRMKAGEIQSIQCQDHVYLSKARILYIPDFKCVSDTGEVFWTEAKGFEGPRWGVIEKLWKHYGPGRLEVFKGSKSNPQLVKEIKPNSGDQE